MADPFVFSATSKRGTSVPINHQSPYSLILGSSDNFTLEAANANSPYVPELDPEVRIPCFAVTALTDTPHASAAAARSRSRAEAPACIMYGCLLCTVREPPVLVVV